MSNERLSEITVIKMSKDLTIDYDDLILQFSSLCKRKMDFFLNLIKNIDLFWPIFFTITYIFYYYLNILENSMCNKVYV